MGIFVIGEESNFGYTSQEILEGAKLECIGLGLLNVAGGDLVPSALVGPKLTIEDATGKYELSPFVLAGKMRRHYEAVLIKANERGHQILGRNDLAKKVLEEPTHPFIQDGTEYLISAGELKSFII